MLSLGFMQRTLFLWQTEAVVRAPMRFFETTPIGRILNRATEDQNSVDTQLCFAFGSLLAQVCVSVCLCLPCVCVCVCVCLTQPTSPVLRLELVTRRASASWGSSS